jgi:large subunit ribosomal protein L15e
MALYRYMQKAWKKPTKEMRQKVRAWRRQPVIKRIEHPTRLDRARSLGYKAKQGFVLARVRIRKGMRRRQSPMKGRKPRSLGVFYTPKMNKQAIAERRVARKFPNLEVLNSYMVGRDGNYNYYEIILVDKHHPSIAKDKDVSWIVNQRRRAFRGLTSAGKKSRGL